MFIGVFGVWEARIQSRFPKPGVAASNPAEGAQLDFPLNSLTFWRRPLSRILTFIRCSPATTLRGDAGQGVGQVRGALGWSRPPFELLEPGSAPIRPGGHALFLRLCPFSRSLNRKDGARRRDALSGSTSAGIFETGPLGRPHLHLLATSWRSKSRAGTPAGTPSPAPLRIDVLSRRVHHSAARD